MPALDYTLELYSIYTSTLQTTFDLKLNVSALNLLSKSFTISYQCFCCIFSISTSLYLGRRANYSFVHRKFVTPHLNPFSIHTNRSKLTTYPYSMDHQDSAPRTNIASQSRLNADSRLVSNLPSGYLNKHSHSDRYLDDIVFVCRGPFVK